MLLLPFLSLLLWIPHASALPQAPHPGGHSAGNPFVTRVDDALVHNSDLSSNDGTDKADIQSNWAFAQGLLIGGIPAAVLGAFYGIWTQGRKLAFLECLSDKLQKEAEERDKRLKWAETEVEKTDQDHLPIPEEEELISLLKRLSEQCSWVSKTDIKPEIVRRLELHMPGRQKYIRKKNANGRTTLVPNPNPDTGAAPQSGHVPGSSAPHPDANNKVTNKSTQSTNVMNLAREEINKAWIKVVQSAGNTFHSAADNAGNTLDRVGGAINRVNGPNGLGVPLAPAVNGVPQIPAAL